jgi:2-hydroxychromene-2-carboxylate isomerase
MTLSVDLFFSFRSPYSYLALPKTLKPVADHDVMVSLRPVYPLAVRVPGFFKRTNPQFARYVVLDSSRVASRENIPFRFPRPDDPIVQDMTTFDVADNQSYIHRLTRLGAAAQLEGRALGFADAISRVLWDGAVSGWNEGDHLAGAAAAAGVRFGRDGCDDLSRSRSV